jgi:hypothetical protein
VSSKSELCEARGELPCAEAEEAASREENDGEEMTTHERRKFDLDNPADRQKLLAIFQKTRSEVRFDCAVVALAWYWSNKADPEENAAYERAINTYREKEGEEAFERMKEEAYTLSLELLYATRH